MAINKVIYGGETLIDLTGDTVTEEQILSGFTAHDKSGEPIEGKCTFDVDSTDATVAVAEMLKGKTAYARGQKLTGDMTNNGSMSGNITSKDDDYTIAQGYHDGSGKVAISDTEKAKLIPTNIKQGIEILGVTGSYGGEAIKAGTGSATPKKTATTYLPSDDGFDYYSQFTVAAIPYVESDNAAGGTTVTIG